MKTEEAIKWVDDRMCFGRGTFTEHHPPNIDECWQAGEMAIRALKMYGKLVRCKDCRDSRVYGKTTQWLACESVMEGQATDPDGYCYLGRRRDAEE